MQTTASGASRPLSATATAQPKAAGRWLFVDNIRVLLTILVLLHHLMITYAGSGSWYYNEGRQDFLADALGSWFCAVNQAFFMGLFLFISAYFVPGSYDRKGAGRFLKDRLIRLGIPLAVYSWIINPVLIYFLFVRPADPGRSFWAYFPVEFFTKEAVLGGGPTWFIEVLLIFSLVYALWRAATPPRQAEPAADQRFPGNTAIAVFALLLGLAGFLVRLVFAMDSYTFTPLNLQLPFFAQYIALFVLGLVAYRRNWLHSLPDGTGRRWLAIAVVFVLAWAPMVVLGGAIEDDMPLKGGWHWQALVYAVWEAFMCISMSLGVVYAFRRYFNSQGRISAFLVPNAYTAYLIHPLVIIGAAYAARDVGLHPLLKWVLVGVVAVPLCFGLSALIRKLPYTERVL